MLCEATIGVKDEGNSESNNEEGSDFGEEVVAVGAEKGAVEETPDEGGGEGDFDMFPGGFVDGSEDADGFIMVSKIINEVGERAENRNDDDTNPHEKGLVHKFIIALTI